MLRNTALLTMAAVTMMVAAGCTAAPAPATSSTEDTVSVPASAPAAEPVDRPSEPASDPGDETAEPTGDPGDPGTPIGDAGDGGNWFGALKPCPQGQAIETRKLDFGDVTGDGVKDALVTRSCEPVTTRWPSTVEVFDGTTGERPRRIGVLLAEAAATDQPWVTKLSVDGNVVTVKAHGLSKDAATACPDLVLTYTYKFSGDGFTRTGRTATRSADCLPVG